MDLPADVPSQNLLTRLTPDAAARFYAAGFWSNQTIYDLASDHARSKPLKVAISDSFCALTYRELIQLADQIATDLARKGLRAGDRVAIWVSSRVELAPFLLACSRNAYVCCPSLHKSHTVDEAAELLQRMTARAFVGEEGFGADGEKQNAFDKVRSFGHVLGLYQLPRPAARTSALIEQSLLESWPNESKAAARADDIIYLAFTSGTTGEPKGVMHSNNTLLANARALRTDWKLDESSIFYTLSPLSHNLGFGALVLTFLVGGSIVLHDLPRGASLLNRLKETGATFVFGVPTHAMDLLSEIEESGGVKLPALRGFRISGAAVAPIIVEKLLSYGVLPQSGYGMTEAGSHHYTLPDDDHDVVVGTSGRACPGYEIEIFSIDDPDEKLPVGSIGQVGGRGATLMLGYFNDQAATESSFNKSGWFMTGDLGKVDERGYLEVTGRIKDIIIRGGHNIHPAKIEILAMRHPQVDRAAVVAVKDARLGEKVCIVATARNRAVLNPQKLLSHLYSSGLSKFDMPEYFIQTDHIPLSASGKVLKRSIVELIAEGLLKPQPVRWPE